MTYETYTPRHSDVIATFTGWLRDAKQLLELTKLPGISALPSEALSRPLMSPPQACGAQRRSVGLSIGLSID